MSWTLSELFGDGLAGPLGALPRGPGFEISGCDRRTEATKDRLHAGR